MGVVIPNPVVLRGLFSFFESHELSSIVLDRSEQATPSRVGIMKETALYLKKRKQSHNFLLFLVTGHAWPTQDLMML